MTSPLIGWSTAFGKPCLSVETCTSTAPAKAATGSAIALSFGTGKYELEKLRVVNCGEHVHWGGTQIEGLGQKSGWRCHSVFTGWSICSLGGPVITVRQP